MLNSSRPPPTPVYDEWNESTAPVDVPVVETANRAEAHSPKRVSLPSIAAPAACRAVPEWCTSRAVTAATSVPHSTVIVPRIA